MSREGKAAPSEVTDPFQSLASEIEERPPIEVEEAPATRSRRQVYWLIGAACAVVIGVAEIVVLFGVDGANAPPVPAAVLEHAVLDACATQAMAVMQVVAAHAERTGAPPPTLESLYPGELSIPPVDPVTGKPYVYEVQGASATVTCPPPGPA